MSESTKKYIPCKATKNRKINYSKKSEGNQNQQEKFFVFFDSEEDSYTKDQENLFKENGQFSHEISVDLFLDESVDVSTITFSPIENIDIPI